MLRLIVIVPFLAVLAIFFFLNTTPVPMNFFAANWQCSVGVFTVMAGLVSFGVGALTVFISLVGQWRRARKAEQKIRGLDDQLNELRAQYIALTQKQGAVGQGGTVGTSDMVATVQPVPVPVGSVEGSSDEEKKP